MLMLLIRACAAASARGKRGAGKGDSSQPSASAGKSAPQLDAQGDIVLNDAQYGSNAGFIDGSIRKRVLEEVEEDPDLREYLGSDVNATKTPRTLLSNLSTLGREIVEQAAEILVLPSPEHMIGAPPVRPPLELVLFAVARHAQFGEFGGLSADDLAAERLYTSASAMWTFFNLTESTLEEWDARILPIVEHRLQAAEKKKKEKQPESSAGAPGNQREADVADSDMDELTKGLNSLPPVPRRPASAVPEASAALKALMHGKASNPAATAPSPDARAKALEALKNKHTPTVTSSSYMAEFYIDDVEAMTKKHMTDVEASTWLKELCRARAIGFLADSAKPSTFAHHRTVQIALKTKDDQLKLFGVPRRDPSFVVPLGTGLRVAHFREPFLDGVSQKKPGCVQLIDVPLDISADDSTECVERLVAEALESLGLLEDALRVNPVLVHERHCSYMAKKSNLAQGNTYRMSCTVPHVGDLVKNLTAAPFSWPEQRTIARIIAGADAPPKLTHENAFTVLHVEPNFPLTRERLPEPSADEEPDNWDLLHAIGADRIVWMSSAKRGMERINENAVKRATATGAPDPMFCSTQWLRHNCFHVMLKAGSAAGTLQDLLGGAWTTNPAPATPVTPAAAVTRERAYQPLLGSMAAVPFESLFPCHKCSEPDDFARGAASYFVKRGLSLLHAAPASSGTRGLLCSSQRRTQREERDKRVAEEYKSNAAAREAADAAQPQRNAEWAARKQDQAQRTAQKRQAADAAALQQAANRAQLAGSLGVHVRALAAPPPPYQAALLPQGPHSYAQALVPVGAKKRRSH
eukprot:tig00020592_g11663.t1